MAERLPEKGRMLLSLVALDAPSLPKQREMFETLAALSGTTVHPKTVEAQERALAFPFGDNTAAVALVPMPIPWSNLEGPCETAWWWPEAGARIQGHQSHLLVVLAGEEGGAVRRGLALTYLTAAVAALLKGVMPALRGPSGDRSMAASRAGPHRRSYGA